ncbi:hypothetical protein Q8F55_005382 [Vanrija albida]|uniref:Enoyl reductase (ER) domain-containing protein n=1 Tax=Vanrija albida TaxID=181172 RepID=A0ABR3Q1I1_9TREE
MTTEYKFNAWTGQDDNAINGNLQYKEITPKPWEEDDVDVKIIYSSICGSDVSGLSGHFGPVQPDRVAGHEIAGEVVRVGSQVKDLKVGDKVGIGAQCDACGECRWCGDHRENLCPKMTFTYGGHDYPRGKAKGTQTYGGFAKYWRGPAKFAVRVPDGLDLAEAAPLCCGGLTVYAPLARYGAGTKAKEVGVVGIGGLGHMAILIGTAMGANVTAISRGTAKEAQAKELGAKNYIATSNDLKKDFEKHARSLDLIICTINPSNLPVADYASLLSPDGTIVFVGVVPEPLAISSFQLIQGQIGVAGSLIGSPADLANLFELAAKKGVHPMIEKFNMDDINTAIQGARDGKPRYRYVLVNTDNGGKL